MVQLKPKSIYGLLASRTKDGQKDDSTNCNLVAIPVQCQIQTDWLPKNSEVALPFEFSMSVMSVMFTQTEEGWMRLFPTDVTEQWNIPLA